MVIAIIQSVSAVWSTLASRNPLLAKPSTDPWVAQTMSHCMFDGET